MESQVNPSNIQDRADQLAAVESAPEVKPVTIPEVKPEVKVEAKPEVKPVEPSIKIDTSKKPDEMPKQPNDPMELRKWATKASQENAELRNEMKSIKAALDKLTKKPVDYKELAKNPEAIQKQIEQERAEAVEEMQAQLEEKTTLAIKNETIVERIKREQDSTNYPEWKRVFPLIQNLAGNSDGRINFNKAPGDVLDDLYALATQLAPAPVVEAPKVEAPKVETPPAPVVKTFTEAEVDAIRKEAFAKAQEAIRQEANGAGLGSRGQGGRRNSGVSKEALRDMPLSDLKKMISQE
jgi:hypothetical protein